MKKMQIFTYLLMFFFFIGVFNIFIISPSSILVPVIVFGIIIYFLKHPEKLSNKRKSYTSSSRTQKSSHPKKKHNFTVIDGSYREMDDEDRPKYH